MNIGAILIRDSWDTRGYRLYEAEEASSRYVVQVDGEINGTVYRTIRDARAAAEARFPGIPVVRSR